MQVGEMKLACWNCGKLHSERLYDQWLKEKRVYNCNCGGQVISNSGKVFTHFVLSETFEAISEKIDGIYSEIKELENTLKIKEEQVESDYRYLQYLKEERKICEDKLTRMRG